MTDTLHDTHAWGERLDDGARIPWCVSCGVDGYENEPAAFLPCVPAKRCGVTMNSWDDPGHVHICGKPHSTGDHHCVDPTCLRWFHP